VTTAGANSNTRSTFRDLIAVLTPSANSRPRPFWMIVTATAIRIVCRIAFIAVGSRNIARKLPKPMKENLGSRPSQLVKA
jgi:hypothetical protein